MHVDHAHKSRARHKILHFRESDILIDIKVLRRSLFLEFISPGTYDPGLRFFVNQKKLGIKPVRGSETRAHGIFHNTALLVVNTR